MEESNDFLENESELHEHYSFTVEKGQQPLRIDKYLMNFVENATRNKIQAAAKDGSIRVNELVVKSNYKVKPLDQIRVLFEHPPHENLLVPENITIDVVYEDDDLLVVNKAPGMVVHPGHGNYSGTLINALLFHFDNLPNNSSNRPGLVHRIDKDTSGLLVVAKTEKAMAHLSAQFKAKTSEREYVALVWGNVELEEGTIEGNIGRHPKNRLQNKEYQHNLKIASRPQTFKDVVGQSAITNTLKNAIDQNHLAQALLFTGPRGVGKTTCARILAKMINSEGAESENEDFAFNIFELDAASNNSVDDIRSLTDQVRIPPQVGNYKVYIIDEVHMLSASAFNAFLKTLEEPPKHCIFILATTEKHKIIPTILSRCQIFDFKRINVTDAKNYLKVIAEEQGITAEDDALHIIAQKADGAMRDALSIFDRVVSFSGKNLTRQAVTENLNVLDYDTFFDATDLILSNKIPDLLLHFNHIISKGFDGHHFITGLASHFRDLLVSKTPQTIELIEVGDDTKGMYKAQSESTSQAFLIHAIELANDCDLKYKTSKNQQSCPYIDMPILHK